MGCFNDFRQSGLKIAAKKQPEKPFDDFQAAFWGGANGWATVGCRGLPLLVVGGKTPALAKNKEY